MTTLADAFDLYDGLISLREAIYYADGGTVGAVIGFDSVLSDGTIVLNVMRYGLTNRLRSTTSAQRQSQ